MVTAVHKPPSSSFEMVIDWLVDQDVRKRQAAVSMLCRVGRPAIEFLLLDAQKPRRQAKHVLAILAVIEQIGTPSAPDDLFALQSLLRHRSPFVRQKAEELILAASPGGMPDSPEGLALVRAFNPFLQPPPRRPRRRVSRSQIHRPQLLSPLG